MHLQRTHFSSLVEEPIFSSPSFAKCHSDMRSEFHWIGSTTCQDLSVMGSTVHPTNMRLRVQPDLNTVNKNWVWKMWSQRVIQNNISSQYWEFSGIYNVMKIVLNCFEKGFQKFCPGSAGDLKYDLYAPWNSVFSSIWRVEAFWESLCNKVHLGSY